MAAILDFSKRSRVRGPHPPGNLCLDLIVIESEEKKTLSNKNGLGFNIGFGFQTSGNHECSRLLK